MSAKQNKTQPHYADARCDRQEVQLTVTARTVSTCAVAIGTGLGPSVRYREGGVDGMAFPAKFTFLDLAGS